MTEIVVAEDNTVYASRGRMLLSKDGTRLIRVPGGKAGKIAVPDGVTMLEAEAMRENPSVTCVDLPASATEIGEVALVGCAKMGELIVRSVPIGTAAALASVNAFVSHAFDSVTLLTRPPEDGDLKAASFAPSETPGRFEFVIRVTDVTIGNGATQTNLLKVLGVTGASELSMKDFDVKNVALDAAAPVDGKVRLTVGPKDTSGATFFMRPQMK